MSVCVSNRIGAAKHLSVVAFALAVVGCGSHTTIYQNYYSDPGGSGGASASPAHAGGSASAGQASIGGVGGGSAGESSAGASGTGASGTGGQADGGTAGQTNGGEGGVSGEGGAVAGDAGTAGSSAAGSSAAGSSDGGASGCSNAAQGALLVPDVPADCHAVTCDGFGHAVRVVYQNNVPRSDDPCVIGTCDSQGVPGTEPAPAGTACRAAGGGIWCDGSGICAECLHTSDCAAGLSCSATEHCVSAPCTDVDCGGACPPCADGKQCLVDADCAGYACDAATLTCMSNQCRDHQQDGNETDADCGGGTCSPCALGKSCQLSSDCLSFACDGVSLVCVSNACADRRRDGGETDVDCGGASCGSCGVGMHCNTNFDCLAGHFCNSTHVCQ